VPAVNAVFTPDRSELDWARRVLDAAPQDGGGEVSAGAFVVDGRMVDRPVLDRARRILARAGR
jgi:citrate lyase beta subunit